MLPLRAVPLRFARDGIADLAGAVDAMPLFVPPDQLYGVEARGDEIVVSGERGVTAWDSMLTEVAGHEQPASDVVLAFLSPPFKRVRLVRRARPIGLFLSPALDSFDAIAAVVDAERPDVERPGATLGRRFRPRAVEVELTQRCNLRCTGCAILPEVERGLPGLDSDVILAALERFAQRGVWGVALTGGEPFVALDKLVAVIGGSPLDVIRVQTNARVFVDDARSAALLEELRAAGLGRRNRFIRPTINVSLGMQQEAGTPIENVARLARGVSRVFGDDVGLVLNVLAWSRAEVDDVLERLDRAHRALFGRRFPMELAARVAHLEYNATPRLESEGLIPLARKTVRERIEALPEGYLCLNFERDTQTPLPRVLLRADGSFFACSCFGFVGGGGRLGELSVDELLARADDDELLGAVSSGGLPALFTRVTATRPDVADRPLPATASICKVCKTLREPDAATFDPS